MEEGRGGDKMSERIAREGMSRIDKGKRVNKLICRCFLPWTVGVLLIMMLAGGWSRALAQTESLHISPQFGFEYYGGTNSLRTLNPWGGLRFGLGSKASFILRYNWSEVRYQYWGNDGQGGSVLKTKKTEISRLSGTIYFGEKNLSGYVSGSYLTGTESYRGYIVDSGLEWRFIRALAVVWSIYSIREKSVLWHPEENCRWINTYSMRVGVKVWLLKGLALNPNLYFMKNSEAVRGTSYSVGLIYSPKWWLALTAYYFRYGETAFYIFHGDYLNLGLNFYF